MSENMPTTEDEWRSRLTPEQFHFTREGGTEAPFTGKYVEMKEPGVYVCVGCGEPLFDSDTKFDSGTGWPSFFQPHESDAIEERSDNTLGMGRIEVNCKKCGAHLGHVFPDGPAPTGLRYCINSCALNLRARDGIT